MGTRNRSHFLDYRCFFITSTFQEWKHLLKDNSYYDLICESLTYYSIKYNMDILGYVIMPNHIHLIVFFKTKNQLSNMMRDFKEYTSGELRRKLEREGYTGVVESLRINRRKQKFKVWMDRFDDVYLESTGIVETKLDYIHDNPVVKSYCDFPEEYQYSSASFYESEIMGKVKITHYKEYF